LRPKAENKNALPEEGPVAGGISGSKRFLEHENPLKMHVLSINVVSITAQIYNALHMQSKKGRLLAYWDIAFFGLFLMLDALENDNLDSF